ncbi:MAG: 30S ribosomal protein S6 [Candidatus Dojkabacteria bacterium]|jgi:small subunit ribosomal protein S6|nr:30S ribosomal protein S6 [Candidatus Dojkabacteria bacterium]
MAEQGVGYEMMVIFKPLLPDDVRKGSHQAIIDIIRNHGGEVVNADVWGKRYLAYPIQSHDEGYYIVYEFQLPPSALSDVQFELKRITEVLRFLISKIDGAEGVGKRLNKKIIDI